MTTAEQFLKQDVGILIANLLFQNAVLKAENETLKAQVSAHVNGGAPARETLP